MRKTLGMESLRKMPLIRCTHRIHALCFFRVGDTVAVEAGLSSPDWSRQVVIVPAHLANDIAANRPPKVLHQFDQRFGISNLSWLHKMKVALTQSPESQHRAFLVHVIVTDQFQFTILAKMITDVSR